MERARRAAMREGALLRELKGEPGILTLHAAFESAREVWLVVELAQTTLGAVAKARGGVPEATLRPWAIDVACGLCALHRLGFVHLDVKPSNATRSLLRAAPVGSAAAGRARLLRRTRQVSGCSVISRREPQLAE